MNAAAAPEPPLYRSEAFAEDVLDLVASVPVVEPPNASARRGVKALPFTRALVGVAFAPGGVADLGSAPT